VLFCKTALKNPPFIRRFRLGDKSTKKINKDKEQAMNSYDDVVPGNPNNKPALGGKLKAFFGKVKAAAKKGFERLKTFARNNKAATAGIVAAVLILAIGIPVIVSATRPKDDQSGSPATLEAALEKMRNELLNADITSPDYGAGVNFTVKEEVTIKKGDESETMTQTIENQDGKIRITISDDRSGREDVQMFEMFVWKDTGKYYSYVDYVYDGDEYFEIKCFWEEDEKYYQAFKYDDGDFEVWEIDGERFEIFMLEIKNLLSVGDIGVFIPDGEVGEYYEYSDGKYALIAGKESEYKNALKNQYKNELPDEIGDEYLDGFDKYFPDVLDMWFTIKDGRVHKIYFKLSSDGEITEEEITYTWSSLGNTVVNVPDIGNPPTAP
jgi:hypothetical protein